MFLIKSIFFPFSGGVKYRNIICFIIPIIYVQVSSKHLITESVHTTKSFPETVEFIKTSISSFTPEQ